MNPTLNQNIYHIIKRHSEFNDPNFIIEKNNTLYVKTGNHCKTNIFVPRNKALYLYPGTQIHFDQNSTLISEGTLDFMDLKKTDCINIKS